MISNALHRLQRMDWFILGALFFLAAVSLVTLGSYGNGYLQKQILWYVIAFLIVFAGAFIDWGWLVRWPVLQYGLYWVAVGLLVVSNLQSHIIRGARSWIVIGGFQFEPSELAKVALILLLAGFFTRRHLAAWRTKYLFTSGFYALLPAALIAIHPDLGSTIIVVSIWIGFVLMSGINKKRFLVGLLLAALALVLVWVAFLKPYQKDRLTAFLSPNRDPLGINYNVIQAKVAIGSAGFLGKGFGEGTQVHLHFLPESQTDFIFAAFTEEWGFLGATLLILTFLLIFYRLMDIGLRAGSNEEKFLILGAFLIIFVQFLINIGSNIGLVPVTGITLPFVSYGGSSLLTVAVLVSIIQHIKLESSR